MAKTQTKAKSPPPAPPKKTAAGSADRPMHPFAFALGVIAILVGIYAAGSLAFAHFKIWQLPGCGEGSGCAGAAASPLGKVPVPGLAEGWPTSHLGFAYFCAIGVAWILSRKGMSTGLRVMIILGAIGSLFYTTNIFMNLDKYLCKYCLACHAANFVLLGLTFMGGGASRSSVRAVVSAGITFGVATGGLAGLGAWSEKATREKGEQELQESIAELIDQTPEATQTPEPTVTTPPPAPTPPADPNAGARTVTTAPPITPDDIVRGAPDLRDRPPAIEVMGYTSGKGFTGHYRIGYEDAPIRVVIFSDYQCKDCQRMEKELFKLLEARNDISFSHRHFPFCRPCNPSIARDMHPNACFGAIAAEVAGELRGPEGFWQFHNWLFDRGGGFTDAELDAALRAFGYDSKVFQQRMMHIHKNGGKIMDRIQADVKEGTELGLHYTPLVFVNGVEMRAFGTPGALTRMVLALADRNPPFGSPVGDHPARAFDKYVGDWEAAAQLGPLGPDRFVAITGNPEGTIRIEAFMDYGSEFSAKLDAKIREAMSGRDDVAYIVRHFSTEKACNPRLKNDINQNSCEMAKAAEAAGRLGGAEAFFQVHNWLLANRATYSTEALRAFVATIGLDPDKVVAMFEDPEVIGAIQDDQAFLYAKNTMSIPHVFINYKDVPRWDLGDENVISAILGRAADVQ